MKYTLFVLTIILVMAGCSPKKETKKSIEKEDTQKSGEQQKPNEPETAPEIAAPVKEEEPQEMPKREETVISDPELWKGYNTAKQKLREAKETGDILQIKKHLLDAAFYAKKLNRIGIEAWQYNNIGFYSIEEFKKRTNYDSKMYELSSMKPGPNKESFHNALKEELHKEFDLIKDAEKYLLISKKLDTKHADESRTGMIESNLSFIHFAKEFIEK